MPVGNLPTGLTDIYAKQISQARQQFQSNDNRPVFSGIVNRNIEPGYGDIGESFGNVAGQILSRRYLKPWMDENDPEVMEKKMYKAFEFANMKEDGLPDSVVQNPGFQEQMAKFLEKVPTAKFLINQSEDGLYRFNKRPRTLDETKATLYPEESRAEIALKGAQKLEHEAAAGKAKEETLWIPKKAEADIKESGAKSTYYNAEADQSKALTKEIPANAAAQRYRDYEVGKAANSQENRLKLDAQKAKEAEDKLLIGAYEKTWSEAEKPLNESRKLGQSPPLNIRVDAAGNKVDASLQVINQLGPTNRNSPAIGTRAVGALYDTFVLAIQPARHWYGDSVPDIQLQNQKYLADKGLQIVGALKGNTDLDDAKRVAWMVIMAQRGDQFGNKKRLQNGWTSITPKDLQSVYGGGTK